MSSLGDSPVPLRHGKDRHGKAHITLATGWWPVQLDSDQARRLSAALGEWAGHAEEDRPLVHGTVWEARADTRMKWRRVEILTRSLLAAGIVLLLVAVGTTAIGTSTTTQLTLHYSVQGQSTSVWIVSVCQNKTVTIRGGGQAWDCSFVLFNNDFANNVIENVQITNAVLSTQQSWPLLVGPVQFVPLTLVGHTPFFGGPQNVTIEVTVGA